MEIGVAIIFVIAIGIVAVIAYRTWGTSDDGRPLGDTPDAHDAINPHDLPQDHPGRQKAEEMAAGEDGETRGMEEGGAAGEGGPDEGDTERVSRTEAREGARTDATD
jgi:hypothetical protein